jgi:hypothetical protein
VDEHVPTEIARAVTAASQLHGGVELKQAAQDIMCQLPRGTVTLVATSVEGAALAAACAAVASSQHVNWHLVNPMWEYRIDGTVIGVAPCDPGEGWKSALRARFPEVGFAFPTVREEANRHDQLRANSMLLVPPQLPGLGLDHRGAKPKKPSA